MTGAPSATPAESARFPFGIPNSWYPVTYSDEIASGELRDVSYFGEDLVLFRGEDGTVGLLDAYCDHLGAHLAHGGRVVGNDVQCPFHNWRWKSDGRCVAIPYASIIPPNARIRHYPVREHSGFVWAWYHKDGREAAFDVPPVAQYGDPDWTPDWIRFEWTVKTHPQEIYENAADWAHFSFVHGFDMPSEIDTLFDGPVYHWGLSTAVGDAREKVRQDTDITGLGCSRIRYVGELDTIVFLGTTPVSADETHSRLAILANTRRGGGADFQSKLKAYADFIAFGFTQDFEIWEHKKYRSTPKLCHRDGPIDQFRRWAAQFYA